MKIRLSSRSILITAACAAFSLLALAQSTPPAPAASPPAAPPPTAPASATAPAQPRPASSRAPMASGVIDWNKLEVKPNATGARRDVFNGPTATLDNFESHITTVNPGQSSHAPHRHGNEELLIVKEGTLEVTINGKAQIAGPGSMIFYASNDLHGTKNVGDVPATYFVLNWVTAKTPPSAPATPAPAATPPAATPAATPAAATPPARTP